MNRHCHHGLASIKRRRILSVKKKYHPSDLFRLLASALVFVASLNVLWVILPDDQALARAKSVEASPSPAEAIPQVETRDVKLEGAPPPSMSVALHAEAMSEGRRDVVRAMFEVAWWPMLGAFSQVNQRIYVSRVRVCVWACVCVPAGMYLSRFVWVRGSQQRMSYFLCGTVHCRGTNELIVVK